MVFEFLYDDQQYFIELQHVDQKKDKMEIFALQNSDSPDDLEEYEIKLGIVEGEYLRRVKVTSLSKSFLDDMAEALKSSMPATFFANPYFDDVMVFFPHSVFTSQDKFAPFSCDECGKPNLYIAKDKATKAGYIAEVHAMLLNYPNPKWPYQGRLLLQFSVSDLLSRLNTIDLDNLAKSILDSLKGVVYTDDVQIHGLVGLKEYTGGLTGTTVAVKELSANERPVFHQHLWTERFKTWRDEIKTKEAQGDYTHFIMLTKPTASI